MISKILLFSSTSLLMTILNKELTGLIPFPLFVVSIQMIGACLMSCMCNVRFGNDWLLWLCNIPPLITIMLISAMYALNYASIGSFVIIRNVLPLFTLIVDSALNKTCPDKIQLFSLLLIVTGAIIYEHGNIKFSEWGLTLLLINLVSCCADRIQEKRLLSKVDTNTMAIVFLNNIPGVLILGMMTMFDFKTLDNTVRHIDSTYKSSLLGFSVLCGVFLNCAGMDLQRSISATTMTVVGCANKLCLILWGIFHKGDSMNELCIIGITLSLLGCIIYGLKRSTTQEDEQPLLGKVKTIL